MDSYHTGLTPIEKGVAVNGLTSGIGLLNKQGNIYGSQEALRMPYETNSLTIPTEIKNYGQERVPELHEIFDSIKSHLDSTISTLILSNSTTSPYPPDLYKPENIGDIINFLRLLGYQKCAKRIEFLQNCDDFEQGEEPLSLESARSFFSFMSGFFNEFRQLGEPIVGIFSKGTLSAEWRTPDNKHLLIEFHANDVVSFAMIVSNPESKNDKFRLNGRGSCKEVINVLRKQGITGWKNC